MDTEKVVSIPQGSILAYRVLQLVLEEDGWGKPIHRALYPTHPLPAVKYQGAVRSKRGEGSPRAPHCLSSVLVRPPKKT